MREVFVEKADSTGEFKKQLPRNVLMTVLSFGTYCVCAVFLTPYLVNHLGSAAYGLVPLAGLLTQYIAIITTQLSGAVRRFLVVEIQRPNGKPNVIFNSTLVLYMFLIAVQVPLFAVAILNINKVFNVPAGILVDVQILFCCSTGSFLVSLLSGAFGVSIFSQNRLDISSTIDLTKQIGRFVFIIVLFSIFGPRLRYIGFVDLGLGIYMACCNVFFCRKLTPELHLNLRLCNVKILLPIFKMSFWTLVNNLGSLLYLRTDIWIINKFISPIAAGQYAALLVVGNFIRRLGSLMTGQVNPTVMTCYAREEVSALQKLLKISVRLQAIIIAIPIGIICGNAAELLEMWLGKDFVPLVPVLWLLVGHLFVNVSVYPLFGLQTAANRVKLPGLVTFVMGIANVIIVYMFGVKMQMGVVGVALGGAIVLTLKNAVFTPIYGSRILGLSNSAFMKPVLASFIVFVFSVGVGQIPFSQWLGCISRYIRLGMSCLFVSLMSVLFIWFFIITRAEKQMFVSFLPGKLGVFAKRVLKSYAWI